jgi:hypothetical protein
LKNRRSKSTAAQAAIELDYVVFFHPDYTVGFGFAPNLRSAAGSARLVG